MGIAVLFTVGSSFTLAKTVRDEHEAKRATAHRASPAGPRNIDHGGAEPYRKAA